jgi:vancomycin resistance protein VanW
MLIRKLKRRLLRAFPWLYRVRVHQLSIWRHFQDWWMRSKFATHQAARLPYSCYKHQSLLLRKLGSSDPELQINKITNLRLAAQTIDGLVIRPGETFSFWQRIGPPTSERGFLPGMQLSQGEVIRGVGGGLCQMANLLYWMALHSPLVVSERHHHSFDPFPDEHRTLPFGSGAGVFYNYVDFRLSNPTNQTFQLSVWLTERHLKGSIQSEQLWPVSYSIFEKEHRFERDGHDVYRSNEIWRKSTCKDTGRQLNQEMIIKNRSLVKYPVDSTQIESVAR